MRATAWIAAVLVFASYAFFHHQGGYNQNTRFDLTRAIVEHGSFQIDAYHGNTGDKALRDGHYYCDKPPGVSLLGVPAYLLAYSAIRLHGGDPDSPRAQRWAWWATRVAAVGALGALLVGVFLHTVAHYCAPRWAVALALGLGLGTLVFPYATLFYGHVPAASLLFAAFALLCAQRRRGAARPAASALAGVLAGAAIVSEYQALLLVALLALYALTAPSPARSVAVFGTGAALPVAGLMAYHTVCFGSPLSTGFAHEALPYWQQRYQTGVYGLRAPDLAAAWQLTLGSTRGLFYEAPWLALALPGLWGLFRRGWRSEAALVTAMTVLMIAFNASLQSWEGGWTLGARYLIPVVPFLAFAAAFADERAVRVAVFFLVPLSVLFMLAGAAVMPEVPTSVPRPLPDFLLPRFLTGQLSVPNPRGAAFNLGQRLGLAGLWSLAPLLLLWTAGGAVLTAATRRSPWPVPVTSPPRRSDAA